MTCCLTPALSIAWLGLCLAPLSAAEAPRVLELRTQQVDSTTYFQLRLDRPPDLGLPTFDTGKPFSDADRRKFARLPQMVPQDGKTRAVYYRHRSTQPGLSFCGQLTGAGKAKFVLLYPLRQKPALGPLPLTDL